MPLGWYPRQLSMAILANAWAFTGNIQKDTRIFVSTTG
jgi:hypothetical protein